ncbi:MAG: pectate lyase, partial [Alphaproteobacteria bacterium HGW-Alphaproteobacteria-10]
MAAFPGVEGYGASATGGRGGKVLIVTNSNDSGTGSLRWALEQNSGPRTVVFAVDTVKLKTNIDVWDGDVTIAGQTARGVEVSGAGINIRDSNVIMRGMMIRPGDSTAGPDPDNRDAFNISANFTVIKDVVVDHNSFSWAVDEVAGIWGAVTNVSFTNNIVAQGLNNSLHSKGAHSM